MGRKLPLRLGLIVGNAFLGNRVCSILGTWSAGLRTVRIDGFAWFTGRFSFQFLCDEDELG
jgi:hypothetical protein